MSPWEQWGPINGSPRLVVADLGGMALYAWMSQLAGIILASHGFRERNWTRFRLASAVIEESCAPDAPWSMNQRRLACGCHSVDFRRRLSLIYEAMLVAVRCAQRNSLPDDPRGRYCAAHTESGAERMENRPRTAAPDIWARSREQSAA